MAQHTRRTTDTGCRVTQAVLLRACPAEARPRVGTRDALPTGMRDTLRKCLAIVVAILAAYFLLHVLRFVTITGEERGVCAGIAGYVVGSYLAAPRRRRKR